MLVHEGQPPVRESFMACSLGFLDLFPNFGGSRELFPDLQLGVRQDLDNLRNAGAHCLRKHDLHLRREFSGEFGTVADDQAWVVLGNRDITGSGLSVIGGSDDGDFGDSWVR